MKASFALAALLVLIAVTALAGSAYRRPASAVSRSLGPPLHPRPVVPGQGFGALPELPSARGVLRVHLTAWTDGESSMPQLRFNGVFKPPLLRVNPGDTIRVRFDNFMRAGAAGYANVSNLHFHGLSVSPQAPSDDVLDTIVQPGRSAQYTVHIPSDHAPGLYWYHTHPHGEAQWQTGNGMSGPLVIEGIAQEAPGLIGMRERVLVLRDSYLDSDETGAPLGAAARSGCGTAAAKPAPPASRITVNDVVQPKIGIAPGEPEFFRVVNAAPQRYFDLAVDGERLRLVAQDGVPLADAPGGGPQMQAVEHILIAPGARAEFVVVGRLKPTALRSLAVDTGTGGDPTPAVMLATFVNEGRPPQARIVVPAHHPPVVYRRPLPAPAARRTVVLTENAGRHEFLIDGKAFSMHAGPLIVARAGTVEEWTLVNDSDEIHAFHLHQVHFIVEDVDGVRNSQRFWADTVTVPYRHKSGGKTIPGRVRILADFRDDVVRGTFVFHCHILDHEDGGMMAKIAVR